ncbi:selenide, water dikinase SelD [soil metagenome]
MISHEEIKLTSLAECAGCAAKLSPAALSRVVEPLTHQTDSRLIVGLHTSDDAAVFRLTDTIAAIQTVDFFTPIVDDPWTFGAIAAANSMSDVYAMGGEVLFTVNVAAFPTDFPEEAIAGIFAGGAEKVREAGAVVAGGHTINTAEPIYGMSVTGQVHPDQVWTKAGAKPGDLLYLTKPIGTGVTTTALKNGAVQPYDLSQAVESMLKLNGPAARAARAAEVNACTDITGYSLLGHAFEMATKSGVRIEILAGKVPYFQGAPGYVEANHVPGGLGRNKAYFTDLGVTIERSVNSAMATLLFDPQTSGGLLFAIPEPVVAAFESALVAADVNHWRIGRVLEGDGVVVRS